MPSYRLNTIHLPASQVTVKPLHATTHKMRELRIGSMVFLMLSREAGTDHCRSCSGCLYARVLTEEAAKVGDIEAMRHAKWRFGLDNPDYYVVALWIAARRGDVAFVRALAEEIGPDICDDALSDCELRDSTPKSRRDAIFTLLEAGFPLPPHHRSAVTRWSANDPRFTAYLL